MIDRRSFLGSMLLAAAAPDIVRASSLMAISPVGLTTEAPPVWPWMTYRLVASDGGFYVYDDHPAGLIGRFGLIVRGPGNRDGVQLDAGEGAEGEKLNDRT